ncbi:hypothetical protein WJ68_16425 [Burkholderia ubonensis]|uniref:Baseplate assembly protein n=1 Tax=Burkholderia ubonensis TaxID=101571 RepID=A0ABD4DZS2_9BURK|nr:hypothetical protein WJ68_16425 [Burkholderia ubonensis]
MTDDDREGRLYRISIPGLTDGASVMPRAQLCNPIGDNSEETEIRIKPGDRVWVAFEGGDPRFPVIVGFRPKNQENGIDWRRFFHANFQFNADSTFEIIANTKVHVKTQTALIEADNAHCTGNLTVDGLLTFNGGMQGKGGAGGGPAMIVSGGAAFSEDVVAAGTSVHGHGHIEQGDGARVSNPVA